MVVLESTHMVVVQNLQVAILVVVVVVVAKFGAIATLSEELAIEKASDIQGPNIVAQVHLVAAVVVQKGEAFFVMRTVIESVTAEVVGC